MDEILVGHFIKYVALGAGGIGIFAGLDLMSGARLTSFLKRRVDAVVLNTDNLILQAKSRIVLGVTFVTISLLMLYLVSITT
jgi:hypothetical protein